MDRLASIVADRRLWSHAEVQRRARPGTTIGMARIKQRRLIKTLASHPGLQVGNCVPFYFCPRSVMLYMIHKANRQELDYHGGQGSIVHLEADLHEAVAWAERKERRWAFTLSNASSGYFEDRCDLSQLDEIDWEAVGARMWPHCKERKQAEFLVERSFPVEVGPARRCVCHGYLQPGGGGNAISQSPAHCYGSTEVVLLMLRRGPR